MRKRWAHNYSTALQRAAVKCHTPQGRHAESLTAIARARDLDPLNISHNAALGFTHYFAHQYAQAIDQCAQTIQMDSDFGLTHIFIGWMSAAKDPGRGDDFLPQGAAGGSGRPGGAGGSRSRARPRRSRGGGAEDPWRAGGARRVSQRAARGSGSDPPRARRRGAGARLPRSGLRALFLSTCFCTGGCETDPPSHRAALSSASRAPRVRVGHLARWR